MFKVFADTQTKFPARKKQKIVKVASPELAQLPDFSSMDYSVDDGGTIVIFLKILFYMLVGRWGGEGDYNEKLTWRWLDESYLQHFTPGGSAGGKPVNYLINYIIK